MTTPTTNLGMSHIQSEFGGANPAALSEYYRGGGTGYVPSTQATSVTDGTAISTSGLIRMGMFRGLTKAISVSLTISGTSGTVGTDGTVSAVDYNIRTRAVAVSGSSSAPLLVTLTINSGVYVVASSTATYALDTDTGWPAGSTISIVNNGLITGKGGAGGAGAKITGPGNGGANNATTWNANGGVAPVVGSAGGTAFRAQYATSFTNNGTIGGGGGGGGGSGAEKNNTDGKGTIYGFGGAGGGGGRGGNPGGAAGAQGTCAGCSSNTSPGLASAGSLTAPGVPGTRAVIGSVGSGGGYQFDGDGGFNGGTGANTGIGGALGTAGFKGGNPAASSGQYYTGGYIFGVAGGAGGAATSGAPTYVTWAVTGTRLGTIG